ncbi:MAG: hypothetical protein JRN56_03640 [Nitrososphaerota archaeon]|nr:hypothetical protein [Nitrososphaerota archaeon]MDG6912481.1 hypothetical protein [Nitrososphaerota archaeon]MDG6920616.1 hypothetical protein [Nitrososphaerota archaeon]MDG6941202.1 hypothetical protein [Nitrososphaerota archaeon]MDG6961476.1 hypothetical protein [Nitrososphaerota archaeon]
MPSSGGTPSAGRWGTGCSPQPQGVFPASTSRSLLAWAGTQLALPVSITQRLIGDMLGAAFTRNVTIVNTELVAETISLCVVASLVALAAAFLPTLAP